MIRDDAEGDQADLVLSELRLVNRLCERQPHASAKPKR